MISISGIVSNNKELAENPAPEEFSLLACIEYAMENLPGGESALKYIDLDMVTRVYVPGIYRPSQLRGCLRKQYYRAGNVPKQTPSIGLNQRLTFDRGHLFGAMVAAYIRLCQDFPELGVTDVIPSGPGGQELVAYDPHSDIGGKVDVNFKYFGSPIHVEVKNVLDPDTFGSLRSPRGYHQAQLNDYMYTSINDPNVEEVKAGFVIYIGCNYANVKAKCSKCARGKKAVLAMKEFFVPRDPEMWLETMRTIRKLNHFVEKDQLPPPAVRVAFDPCDGCAYSYCCGKTLGEISSE